MSRKIEDDLAEAFLSKPALIGYIVFGSLAMYGHTINKQRLEDYQAMYMTEQVVEGQTRYCYPKVIDPHSDLICSLYRP